MSATQSNVREGHNKLSEREELMPYLLEAGIDPDRFINERRLVIEELMMYHVIYKRILQILDIGKGMCLLFLTNKTVN